MTVQAVETIETQATKKSISKSTKIALGIGAIALIAVGAYFGFNMINAAADTAATVADTAADVVETVAEAAA